MDCNKFKDNVLEYIEDGLRHDFKEEMTEHMRNCEDCSELYTRRLSARNNFNEVVGGREIVFQSRKSDIMNAIDNKRYSTGIANKIYFHFRRNNVRYASCAAAVMFMFVLGSYFHRDVRYLHTAVNSETAVEQENGSIKDLSADNIETTSQDSNLEILSGSRQKINPTGDGVSALVTGKRRAELVESVKEMKGMAPGVGPWIPIYSDNKKILYYNTDHLLAYNNTEKYKGIYNVVELRKLNVGSYQGSSVVRFSVSPNGQYCIIGTYTVDDEVKNLGLYLFDLENNTEKKLGSGVNMKDYRFAWSDSSEYLAIGNTEAKKIVVHNLITEKEKEFSTGENKLEKLYISDKGDVLVGAKDTAALHESGRYEQGVNWPIDGEIINYNLGGILYFNSGSILKQEGLKAKTVKKVADIGKEYKPVHIERDWTIFTNTEFMRIYNIKTGEINEFKIEGEDVSMPSPDSKMLFQWGMPSKVLTSSGERITINTESLMGDYVWKNNNTLVTVRHKEENYKYGEYRIIEINVDTMKGKVVFEP